MKQTRLLNKYRQRVVTWHMSKTWFSWNFIDKFCDLIWLTKMCSLGASSNLFNCMIFIDDWQTDTVWLTNPLFEIVKLQNVTIDVLRNCRTNSRNVQFIKLDDGLQISFFFLNKGLKLQMFPFKILLLCS